MNRYVAALFGGSMFGVLAAATVFIVQIQIRDGRKAFV